MPVYRVQVADGRVVRVQGNNPDTASASASAWAQANPKASLVGDLKAFGSGALGGAVSLGNMFKPGGDPDVASAINQGGEFLATHFGGQTRAQASAGFAKAERARAMVLGPTSTESQQAAGLYHAPQNTGEELANATGAFLPNAFAPGAGDVGLARLLGGALVRVAAPTATSVGAKNIVKAAGGGPLSQTIASTLGGLVGGGSANLATAPESAAASASRAAETPPPRTVTNAMSPPPAGPIASQPGPAASAAAPPAAAAAPAAPGAPPTADIPRSVTSLTPVQQSAVGKFVRVAKPDVTAMTDKANAFSGAGIDPTLVDTAGRRGQAVVRALASRPTPAQDAVEQFAAQRRTGLASRMSDQARSIISSDPRTPEEITKEVVDARTAQANTDFQPIRDQTVNVTPQMAESLSSDHGLAAIRDASKNARSLDDRESLKMLYDHLNPGQTGLQSGIPPSQLSIGQVQDISRELFSRADAAATDSARDQMNIFGQNLRQGARIQSPAYEEALTKFANASALSDAPAIGKTGLAPNTDGFISSVDGLRQIPGSVNAFEPVGITLAKPGFRRAIEQASGGGRPGTALGVAETLADAPEQQAKNAALLGPDDATKLQDAMRLERQAVLNATQASPGAGSNTFLNQAAGGAVNGEISAGDMLKTAGSGLALAHGNPIPAAGQALEASLKQTRAFSDEEAEAMAHMAIDPGMHDALLQAIATRVGAQNAAGFAPIMQNVAASAVTPGSLVPNATSAANAFGSQNQPPPGSAAP